MARKILPHHAPVTDADLTILCEFINGIKADAQKGLPEDFPRETVQFKRGKVNAALTVYREGSPISSYGFVELATGAIMKSSGRAPEPKKYERGNVHQPDGWPNAVGPYGVAYMR
jgi:hypothetical protein